MDASFHPRTSPHRQLAFCFYQSFSGEENSLLSFLSLPQSLLESSQANLSDKPLPNDLLIVAILPNWNLSLKGERPPPCSCLFLFFNPHWKLPTALKPTQPPLLRAVTGHCWPRIQNRVTSNRQHCDGLASPGGKWW